ncbi:hypothetical protein OLV35_04300 [Campylobacter jejuni]|nr:hypothetical protein [Campylobacter jejuni]
MKKYKKDFSAIITNNFNYIILYPFLYPSYWEFRRLCKLNNYPKSEEKYNRILAYF